MPPGCYAMSTGKYGSEIRGKVLNVVLEKDGVDQLGRSCEKLSIA
jgi:hypothetical protein